MTLDSGNEIHRRNEEASTWPGTAADNRGPAVRFTFVFGTVVFLTVLALTANVALTLFGNGSDEVRTAAESCSTTYKLGFGAIVGLLGAKAT